MKGMLLSSGGGAGPQESCKDHPQSNRSKHSKDAVFSDGYSEQLSISSAGQPFCGINLIVHQDRERKGQNSGVSSMK